MKQLDDRQRVDIEHKLPSYARKRETRSQTVLLSRLTLRERAKRAADEPDDGVRRLPMMRGDCGHVERPCPYVSCRYHLFVDVNPNTGNPKFNFPDLFDADGAPEVELMKATCVLDVADRDGVTLEGVGEILNVTKERVRQIEEQALVKLKDRLAFATNEAT